MNRIVVSSVDLNAIETRFSSARSSLSKACNQVSNLIGRHRPWRLCPGTQRCNRGRRTQTLFTYQLGLCDAATIIYLEDRKTSCSTHRFSEPARCRPGAERQQDDVHCPSCGRNMWGKPDTAVFCKPYSIAK